ncbi:MAG: hypothetical protein GXO39_05520 [Thermotogae bacterium]|nr:hypothetical protein [Thermotogota bacterium]
MRIKVAVAQIRPILANVERNLTLHLERIEAAKLKGADLIVFPELSLTGYYLGWLVPQVALKVTSLVWEKLARPLNGSVAAVGAVLEEKDMFYNALVILSGEGILGIYKKVYLPTYGMFDEGRYFASGREFNKIRTPYGEIAPLICEDAWHMDAYLSRADADLFILAANNPFRVVQGDTAVGVWHRLASLPATFFGTPTVYANRVGVEDGIIFFGGSRVYQGDGEVTAEGILFEDMLLIGEIDTTRRRAARFNSATLREHLNHAIGKGS